VKKQLILILILFFFCSVASASTSISLSVSPSTITQGETAVVTATVSASGQTESNVQVQISVPSGLSVSGSATQVIESITAGSSQTVTWNVSGDVASDDAYTITAAITGGSSAQAYLTVNSPALIATSNFSCDKTSMNYSDTVTMSFTLENNGGSSTNAQVNVSATLLSLTSGNSSWSSDMNAGSSTGLNYTFTGSSSSCGTATITAAITSNVNNPDDLSCNVTITGCPSTQSEGNAVCGNNICEASESCSNCSKDCGECEILGKEDGATKKRPPSIQEKIEVILEKTISSKPTPKKITEILTQAGASKNAIEKASAAIGKTFIERKITVEKITDKKGNVSYRSKMEIKVTNQGKNKLKNIKIIEFIPKSVALNASEISSEFSFNVLKDDPIIEFIVPEIRKGESIKVVYFIEKKIEETTLKEFSPAFVSEFTEETNLCEGIDCDDSNPCTEDYCELGSCFHNEIPNCIQEKTPEKCSGKECEKEGFPLLWILIPAILIGIAGALFYYIKSNSKNLKGQ
jgi:hypothetical protein